MRIWYLPTNQAWCVVWHEQIIPIGDRRLFESREELVSALEAHNLKADRNGIISAA